MLLVNFTKFILLDLEELYKRILRFKSRKGRMKEDTEREKRDGIIPYIREISSQIVETLTIFSFSSHQS